MDQVITWVKKLIFIILFTTLMEMFLPDKNMRKYVRIVLGFFIVIIFLSPLTAIFNQDLSTMYRVLPSKMIENNWEDIKRRGDEISDANRTLIKEYYGKRIGERVKEVIDLDYSDWDKNIVVKVDDNYQLERINITLSNKKIYIEPVRIGDQDIDTKYKKEEKAKINDLKYKLSRIFQIPENKIDIAIDYGGD